MNDPLLSIRDLTIHYEMEQSVVEAVNGMSFDVFEGEAVGLVGETGAGKTTTALGIMRLIQTPPGHIVQGSIRFMGEDLLQKSETQMRDLRGNEISIIFQDPMSSLNPIHTVGEQIGEVLQLHHPGSKRKIEKAGGPHDGNGQYSPSSQDRISASVFRRHEATHCYCNCLGL